MFGVWTLSLGVAATGPALQALYTSHGTPIVLKPAVYDYTVLLNVPTASVALIPKINVASDSPAPAPLRSAPAASAEELTNSTSSFWEKWSGEDPWSKWKAQSPSAENPMCDTRVRMSWNGMPLDSDGWVEAETSALAMMKQIPLPEDGQDLVVKIELEKLMGREKPVSNRYTVRYKQRVPAPTGLVGLEATDNNDQKCIVAPTLGEDVQDYYIYADPRAKRVTLKLRCRGADGSTVVNGSTLSSSRRDGDGFYSITLDRDLTRHTQLVQVACSRASSAYKPPSSGEESESKAGPGAIERRYAVRIISDYTIEELDRMPSRIHLTGINQDCQFDSASLRYLCPDPKLAYHSVQLQTENEPTVKYTLFNDGRSVELRLLNRQVSVPFTYTGAFTVRLESGRYQKDYPLYFDGSLMRTFLGLAGSLVGTLLFLLTGALLCIIGASSVFTLGFPIGATEIAGTFAFIIQYLCFSQTLKGSPRLTEFTEPLKWFTLFAPPPVSVLSDDCSLRAPAFCPGALDGTARVGDLRDYRNAQGALTWGLVLLAGFAAIHSGVLFRFRVLEKQYTAPHHVMFGGWENRVLHSLLFPLAVAATYCLTRATDGGGDSGVCPMYKALSGAILFLYAAWICYEAVNVHSMVKEGRVVWIWNASVREDGRIEDESGYWTDALADQLLTQPLNRTTSRLRSVFPFTWVSPVADIVPQRVLSGGSRASGAEDFSSRMIHTHATPVADEDVRPTQKYRTQTYGEANYGLAKTPQCVEVVRCRKPGGLCRGQRLIAGLLRTSWLDILFTYESLTQLHSNITGKYFTTTRREQLDGRTTTTTTTLTSQEDLLSTIGASQPLRASPEQRNFIVPIIVKTSQLSGPLTGGSAMFFFDGTRVPFIRIADSLYRLIVGLCLGVVLAKWSTSGDAAPSGEFSALFGLISGVSMLLLAYTAITRPYTRAVEGWLSVATLATVATSAAAFSVYYLLSDQRAPRPSGETSLLADLALWLMAGSCFLLGAYSLVIDSSILAAVLCPPLDETRFMESLANVSVAVSDNGKRVETPGFSKFPVAEIMMQATQTGRERGHAGPRVHVSVMPSKQEPCLEFSEKQIRQACQNATLPLPMATVVARSQRESLGYKYLQVTRPEALSAALPDFLTNDEQVDAFPGTVAREIARHVKYQTETRGRNGQTLLTVNIAPPTANH